MATIQISVLGDVKGFQKSMQQVQRDLGKIGTVSNKAGAFLGKSMKVLGTGALVAAAGVAVFTKKSLAAGEQASTSNARIEQIATSMKLFGDETGAVSKRLVDLANKTALATGVDQNSIKATQAKLLTFKEIGKSADEVGGAFDRATMAAVDLASAGFGTAEGNAAQLGKALQDPIKGLASLAKSGVTFTDAEKERIATLVESGKVGKAQNIVLKAIENQVGGTAKATANASDRMKVAWSQVQERIGVVLLPYLEKLADYFTAKVLPAGEKLAAWLEAKLPGAIETVKAKMDEWLPRIEKVAVFVKDNAKQIGIAVAAFYALTTALAIINPIVTVAIGLFKAFKAIMVAVKVVQVALNILWMANPIGLVIVAIAALVAIFVLAYKKSETFRKVVDAAWNGIKAATVAVWNFLKNITKATWNAIKVVITTYVKTYVAVVKGAWNAIKAATSAVWNAIKAVVSAVVRAIKAVVSSGFNAAKAVITSAWNAVKSVTTSVWNGIKAAVQNAINGVKNIVGGIKGFVTSAMSGAGSWLISAGKDIIQGLLSGISSMVGAVKDKLGALTNMIPDWKGPRRRDKRLLRPAGRLIMKGLIAGLQDGRGGVKKNLQDLTKQIEKFLIKNGVSKKVAAQSAKTVARWGRSNIRTLKRYAGRLARVGKKIEKAQKRLADIRKAKADYKASIKDAAKQYASLTNLNSAFTADAMLQQMRARIDKIKQYNALLKDLIAKGLNKEMVDQLAQAGVEGGLAYAQAISQGGPDAIKEFNAMQADLNSAGNALGNTTANNMYNSGVQAAQGLLKGLRSKRRAIAQEARRYARILTRSIKKALKIKSPSRVFADVGKYTVAGLSAGLGDKRQLMNVQRASGGMAKRIERGFDQPSLSLDATHASSDTGQTHNVTLNINVPSTADKAAVGREVASALDAYYKQGGRRLNL